MNPPEQASVARVRVFISYSHDSREHCDRVLAFAQQLRRDGIEAELDQFHQDELLHWPRWCEEQLRPENSKYVVCVCTAEYRRRVENRVPADVGKGVFWEATLIYDYLYDEKGNRRCVPVLMGGAHEDAIPRILFGWNRYELTTFRLNDGDPGYEGLSRLLTGRPKVKLEPVGEPITLLEKEVLPPLEIPERKTDFIGLIEEIHRKVAHIEQISIETKADTSEIKVGLTELVGWLKSGQAIPVDWADRQEKLAERVGISEQALVTIAARLGVENVPTAQLGPALIDRIDRLRLAQQQAEALPADNPIRPLVEAATKSGAYDRAETLLSVAREQVRAVGLIEENQPDRAMAALDDATRHLGAISEDSPVSDRLALGYIYKTYAQIFSAKRDQARADDYLDKAEAIFKSIAHGPQGATAVQYADAIHGIGNIHHARNEYRQAIDDYKIATTILPTYAYAWYDMFLCYAELAKGGEVDLPAMRLTLAKTKETGKGAPGLDASIIAELERILARFERENGQGHGPSQQ